MNPINPTFGTPATVPVRRKPVALVADGIGHVIQPDRLYTNPKAAPAADPGALRVVSYNIEFGGKRLDKADAALRQLNPDVVLLQEASKESARALADSLGLHMVYMGSRFHPRGKAILSRSPITAAEDLAVPGQGLVDRVKSFFRKWKQTGSPIKSIEPLQKRTVLHATIQAGGRTVHLVDVHQSLAQREANTAQMRFLAQQAAKWQQQGDLVVAGGDFNTDFSLTTATQKDPANQAAVEQLRTTLQDYWTAPTRQVIASDRTYTPEQAREALAKQTPGRPEFERLSRVADGDSHIGAKKRFDNVLVSPGMKLEAAVIDQASQGSDHQPVLAVARF